MGFKVVIWVSRYLGSRMTDYKDFVVRQQGNTGISAGAKHSDGETNLVEASTPQDVMNAKQ